MSRKFSKVDEQMVNKHEKVFFFLSIFNHTYENYSVILISHLSQNSYPKTTTAKQITVLARMEGSRNPCTATRNVS